MRGKTERNGRIDNYVYAKTIVIIHFFTKACSLLSCFFFKLLRCYMITFDPIHIIGSQNIFTLTTNILINNNKRKQ